MIYYTYIYLHPETFIPRYVGKGSGNRARQHLSYSDNKSFNGWLKKLKIQRLKPIIYYSIKNIDESTALSHEIFWIAVCGRLDKKSGLLFNHTEGGDGGFNFKANKTSFKKGCISLNLGKKWSEKCRENSKDRPHGKGMTGKKHSTESIAKRTATRLKNKEITCN